MRGWRGDGMGGWGMGDGGSELDGREALGAEAFVLRSLRLCPKQSGRSEWRARRDTYVHII